MLIRWFPPPVLSSVVPPVENGFPVLVSGRTRSSGNRSTGNVSGGTHLRRLSSRGSGAPYQPAGGERAGAGAGRRSGRETFYPCARKSFGIAGGEGFASARRTAAAGRDARAAGRA